MRPYFIIIFGLCTFLFTSCGYYWGNGNSLKQKKIYVPYVIGDQEGDFTAILIKNLSLCGFLPVSKNQAELELRIEIVDYYNENIGYRYDRKKSGERTTSVVPTETRAFVVADLILTDCQSNCVVIGPIRFLASVDFDHEFYSTRDAINIFSLGQLNDIDEAQDAAYRPLHHKLSEKIVDYLSYCFSNR